VSPTPFLPVRPHFSTILWKFAYENFFPLGVTPWRVSAGAVHPPSDAIVVLHACMLYVVALAYSYLISAHFFRMTYLQADTFLSNQKSDWWLLLCYIVDAQKTCRTGNLKNSWKTENIR